MLSGSLILLAAILGFVLELPVFQRRPTRFNGSFEFSGRYRGAPSPEIDQEWNRFTKSPWIDGTSSIIAVDEGDIRRANKSSGQDWLNTTVEYGHVNGGGYMATLELFHQLHCVV
ncbi:hypothetical protein G6O67_008518 [Ophiocordyceps sinensis]|uniref:Uncharacterized protein n=1 Tax=Ophiocordyceps sinensis TaxID=72228 RepID=A0A8H4LRK9_9HYPO|nr:hypothetical protein G6O67_008518 [Ophiocordyceps sinensis]